MSVIPAEDSWLAWPLYSVRQMLSRSATLQAWGGDADAAEALGRVHLFAFGTGSKKWYEYQGPQVVVDWSEQYGAEREATLTGADWFPSGEILLLFQSFVADLDADDPELDMANRVGLIINDLSATAGDAGNLSIQDFRVIGFNRADPEQADGYHTLDLYGSMRFVHPYG